MLADGAPNLSETSRTSKKQRFSELRNRNGASALG